MRFKGTPGFTLIEVMVSVSIMAVMMIIIWSTTSQSLRGKDRTEKRDLAYHMGRVVLRKFRSDIDSMFLAIRPKNRFKADNPSQLPSIKTFLIGEDNGSHDSIRFTSLSHLRLFKNAKESDECKIGYEVVPSKDASGVYDLVRKDDPWLNNSYDIKGRPLILVKGIREFNVEYYNQRKAEWVSDWDTRKLEYGRRLPVAVRLKIAFADPNDKTAEIQMSTEIIIELHKFRIGT